jgi:hypothetical protein
MNSATALMTAHNIEGTAGMIRMQQQQGERKGAGREEENKGLNLKGVEGKGKEKHPAMEWLQSLKRMGTAWWHGTLPSLAANTP